MSQTLKVLKIHVSDNVAVAIQPLSAGDDIEVEDSKIRLNQDVPFGHKIAVEPIARNASVRKYGHVIGHAELEIIPGDWVHSHNLSTDLSDLLEYKYTPTKPAQLPQTKNATFQGYRRANGKVGTRNEIWVINTVGCVNMSAERIARYGHEQFAGQGIDGVYSFTHPYGCSQLGDDLAQTQAVLAGLISHPNAGGVLIMGLGCESNQMRDLLKNTSIVDESRVRFFNAQDVPDEVEHGSEEISAIFEIVRHDKRTTCDLSDLVLGVQCGGSDAFSGITANPLVGRVTEFITANNGTVILTEVPEMFGAEQQLMNRATDKAVFDEVVGLINDFKTYFKSHNQPIYENPSPGNKEGGLTTLEEKSLGAIQKGGSAPVCQVLRHAEPVKSKGLALANGPGNDATSATGQVANGATLLLFTTGRGTPLGLPVPTLKIATNTSLYERKPRWIDFDAGQLLTGKPVEELGNELLQMILAVASGDIQTKNEFNGYREIAIWKGGVTN